jgi:hypothetical protein
MIALKDGCCIRCEDAPTVHYDKSALRGHADDDRGCSAIKTAQNGVRSKCGCPGFLNVADVVREVFEATAEAAPGIFLEFGHHAPIVMVGLGIESDIVALDISDDEAADMSFDTLQRIYQDKCLWFVCAIEMWMMPAGVVLAPGERPSEREDRIECLLVQGASRDGAYARQIAWRVIRNGDTLDLVKHFDEPGHSMRFEQVLFGKEARV